MTRAIVLAVAVLMTVPVPALASAGASDSIVADWTKVLLSRDPDAIAAMPSSYPGVGAGDNLALASEVLDAVAAEDAEVRAHVADPAARASAVEMLAKLMFDRAALSKELRTAMRETETAAPPSLEPIAPDLPQAEDLDPVREAVEADARLPATLASVALAIDDVPDVAVAAPRSLDIADLLPLDGIALGNGLVPGSYRIAWQTDRGRGISGNLAPGVPNALDVTGDVYPDFVATLAPAPDLASPLALSNGLLPGLALSLVRVNTGILPAMVVGVVSVDGAPVVAGFDAWSPAVPANARDAPASFLAQVSFSREDGIETAGFAALLTTTKPSLRVLGGLAARDPLAPERVVTLDLSPVPNEIFVTQGVAETATGGTYSMRFEADQKTSLDAQAVERNAAARLTRLESLTAADLEAPFTLTVERNDATGAEAWEWESTSPLADLTYAVETTKFDSAALATPVTWRRAALLLEDVPAGLAVDVPSIGRLELTAGSGLSAIGHELHTFDYARMRETFDRTVARGVPGTVKLGLETPLGRFTGELSDVLSRLETQSAVLERSRGVGDVSRLLFDLSGGVLNFVGIRGETATGGRALALRLLELRGPVAVDFGELPLGLSVTLRLPGPLGPADGLIQVDHHRTALTLSGLPRDLTLSARFDAALVEIGYAASEGIAHARASYTNLLKAGGDVTKEHAYADLKQLPSALTLTLTRVADAPHMRYVASTSTLDVRAFVTEALFDGNVRARALLDVVDLGADFSATLVAEGGKKLLRMASSPATGLLFLEGFLAYRFDGRLNERIDGGFYEVLYGYDIAADVVVKNLRVRIPALSALDVRLEAPNLAVTGRLDSLTLTWDTIELRGPSAAWLQVYAIVLFWRYTIWDWGWSAPSIFNLDFDVTPFQGHWAELYGVDVLWCRFSIEAVPHPHATTRNAITLPALSGDTWYFFLNPIDARGNTLVPHLLAVAYVIWRHGDWRFALDC